MDAAGAAAHHRRVVGHREQRLGRVPGVAGARLVLAAAAAVVAGDLAVGVARGGERLADGGDVAAEADRVGDLGALELPRVAEGEPVIGQLVLYAALDHLAEQPVLVADAISVRRDAERRHALHEAGGEAAEPAIAQAGIRLLRAQPVQIHVDAGQRLAHRLGQAEIAERVEQQAADQELEREIVDPLAAALRRLLPGQQPAIDHRIPQRQGGGDEPVPVAGGRGLLADLVGELVQDVAAPAQRVGPPGAAAGGAGAGRTGVRHGRHGVRSRVGRGGPWSCGEGGGTVHGWVPGRAGHPSTDASPMCYRPGSPADSRPAHRLPGGRAMSEPRVKAGLWVQMALRMGDLDGRPGAVLRRGEVAARVAAGTGSGPRRGGCRERGRAGGGCGRAWGQRQ